VKPDQFIQSRQDNWKTLTHLLDRCQGGVERLSTEDVDQLGRLYRAAASDLAIAQRDFPTHRATVYLNQLVARAHATLYRGDPFSFKALWHFVTTSFPGLYRETSPFIITAALLTIIPALMAGVATAIEPASARWMLPPEYHAVIPLIERQELWVNIPIDERPYASAFIMQNNIQVSFLAFGGGMLAGLFTLWVMVLNGLLLGGITGLTIHYGVGFELWTFVIGHGVIELSVIFVAGGSGLMLGWAILQPGLLRRRDALARAANKAVRLVVGCVVLLVVAGLIEGLISPAENVPVAAKWALGIASGLLLYSYLLFSGRPRTRPPPARVRRGPGG
jgi:uncharacterized membrane protein SpoIIM required for sporulation